MNGIRFKSGRCLPTILQTEYSECALACLAMMSGYYGHKIDIITLRNKYSVSQHGVTLKDIIKIAEKMNMSSRAVRLDIDEINRLKMPAVLHWDMNHFVVLKKVHKKKIVIHDPAVGVRDVTFNDLGKHFTGVALELTPTKNFKREDETKKFKISHLWSSAVGLKRGIIQLLLLSLVLELFAVVSPYFTQLVIDDVLVSNDIPLLKILIIGFFLVVVIQQITGVLRSFVVLHFTTKITYQFAINIFRHLIKLPFEYFIKRHIGDILSRFNSQQNIRDFLTSGIVGAVLDGIMVVITVIMMLIYNKKLSFIIFVAVILYAVLRLSTFSWIRNRTEEMIVSAAKENTNFIENIRTMQGIKLFGKESDRLALWQNYYVDVINTGIRVQKFGIFVEVISGFISNFRSVLILYFGAASVLNNEFSVGMLIAFTSWSNSFLGRALALLDKGIEFRLLDVHLTRMADIVYTEVEQNMEGSGVPALNNSSKPLLDIKDLAFRYSEDHPFIFSNINLTIENDETIAIIGPSGCGKSTLIKLMSSLYQPTHGEILMYDKNIKEIGLQHYRVKIGVIMQDDNLLTGSISDNICFFDSEPDQKSIEHAASLAAIHDDIEAMSMQYNTLVGNLGVALSGGQIQRILLARTIYKKPDLIFLDEATSHLDVNNEKLVNNAIKKLKMSRVIVAHRPETIKLADRIFQLTPSGLIPVIADQLDFYDNKLFD